MRLLNTKPVLRPKNFHINKAYTSIRDDLVADNDGDECGEAVFILFPPVSSTHEMTLVNGEECSCRNWNISMLG